MISAEFADYLLRKSYEWDEKIVKDIRPFEFKGEWRQWNGDWWETREEVRRLSEGSHYKPSKPIRNRFNNPSPWDLQERIFNGWPKSHSHDWVPAASGMVGDPL